ncbi:MAG: phosphotransferase, partial [Candidatus Eisenbacteria bacterium]|nr:phosphotransferase [Candidatus Eisenbacteria bacterium]
MGRPRRPGGPIGVRRTGDGKPARGGAMEGALKSQERALDPRRALKLLRETAAASEWEISRVKAIETVKLRPGRRLTIRYRVRAGRRGRTVRSRTVYGKLYRGRKGERVARTLQFLREASARSLRFPELIGYNARRRFLLTHSLKGEPLSELLLATVWPSHLANFACSLAALHAVPACLPSAGGPVELSPGCHGPQEEGAVLTAALERLEAPELPDRLRLKAGELHDKIVVILDGGGARTRAGPPCLIHRDLYPEQVLVDDGRPGFIDLDELAAGEAELDLGNFIA